jgi:hypothetical protein
MTTEIWQVFSRPKRRSTSRRNNPQKPRFAGYGTSEQGPRPPFHAAPARDPDACDLLGSGGAGQFSQAWRPLSPRTHQDNDRSLRVPHPAWLTCILSLVVCSGQHRHSYSTSQFSSA